jgi:hypothetical protein
VCRAALPQGRCLRETLCPPIEAGIFLGRRIRARGQIDLEEAARQIHNTIENAAQLLAGRHFPDAASILLRY